jgi:predicted deacetylase
LSKKISPVEDGIALLSVHDISPYYEDEVVQLCDQLDAHGITSYSLLTTPFYGMKRSNSFEKNELFAEYLVSLGLEISMHGYSHQTKSGKGAEFYRMPQEQVASRLKLGITLMKKGLGLSPVGFVPPMWKAPQSLTKITGDIGLSFCVIGDTIYDLKNDTRHSTTFHLVSQGQESFSQSDAFLELELGGPVQIGIHPLDSTLTSVLELLADMKDRLGYAFKGYNDYLSQ